MNASYYIQALHLQAHPEGGYFAETYRAAETIVQSALPDRFSGSRSYGTAIYFLLENTQFSALHRIQSDEVWHFYAGGPLTISVISPGGELTTIRLGNRTDRGEVFQAVVKAGCWFGSSPAGLSAEPATDFSLVGCTVAPGFDFADFELGNRAALLAEFPQHQSVINRLTTEN